MNRESAFPEQQRRLIIDRETLRGLSCPELIAYLAQNWEALWKGEGVYLTSLLALRGCRDVVPYLKRQLDSDDPLHRWRAFFDLERLQCRECRELFISFHLDDPDEDVRRNALLALSSLFRGEKDGEILRLALSAFDNPSNSVAVRLYAGAAMILQLEVPKELGEPNWWDEEEEELQHPGLLWAVSVTRQLLAPDEEA